MGRVDDPTFTVACWAASVSVLLGFGAMAVWLARKHARDQDLQTFITARRSQPLLRVAWSFYAGSIGCYPAFGGWISIATYAVSTGLPLLLIAEFGWKVLKRVSPEVMSLNDFAGRMYGRPIQAAVAALSLVNMAVALISEYTAIGDLFEFYVGGPRVLIILIVGGITSVYTAAGGLLVSIWTDQAQATLSLLLILAASIYLGVEFREPLRQPLPENLGVNYSGLSSIFSLPISLLSSAVFSDVFWARVWSAEDKTSLKRGAFCGFLLTTIVIAFFGFVGFLGQWAALPPLDEHNNLAFFVPFHPHGNAAGGVVIRVLIVVLAATMSQSAVDSLQNAINANLSSTLLAGRPVAWSRALVFLFNIPIVALSLQRYALLDLFLALNVVTTTAAAPLLSGLWLPRVSGATVLLASAGALASTCALGVAVQHEKGRGAAAGLRWVFTSQENQYDYRIFVTAALTSIAFTLALWFLWDTRGKGLELLAEARLAQQVRREAARSSSRDGARDAHEGSSSSSSSSLRQPFLSRCPCPLNRGPAAWRRQQEQRERPPLPLKIPTVASCSTSSITAMLPSAVVARGDGGGNETDTSGQSPTISPEHSIMLDDDEDSEWDCVAGGEGTVMGTFVLPPPAQRIGGGRGDEGGSIGLDMA